MVFDISHIKNIRRQIGLTQHQFAREIGVSQSMVAKLEAGKLDPAYSKVKQIAKAIYVMMQDKEIKAKEIMTQKIISVSRNEKAGKIIEIMNRNDISQVPVIERGHVLGLVSESSIISKNLEDVKKASVKDVMIDSPPIIEENARLEVIKQLLVYYPIVLVKKAERLVGVITRSDLVRSLIK